MWIAGADGCAAGWLVVFRSVAGQSARACVLENFVDIFAEPEQPKIIAVDIPIGLPAISRPGGRSADIEARRVLKLRKSSIFPAPSRRTLEAKTFEEARDLERDNSEPPKMLAIQAYNLFEKILQLDGVATRYRGTIFECHPEVSFWAMNNRKEMSLPKRKKAGFEERCRLLARNKFERSFLNTRVGSYDKHTRDDFADACAAAWTAERILRKEAIRFPPMPEIDCTGLDMAIWA